MQIKITKKSKGSVGGFFTKGLENYLNKKASSSTYPRRHVIRPSEIGGCKRLIVLSILNIYTPPVPTPRQQRIFDNGNYVHKRYLREYLGNIPDIEVISIEKSFRNQEYWLKGSPDAIIRDPQTNKLYVFELKSMKSEDFEVMNKPSSLYEAQLRIYMFLTDIPQGIIVYENKNNQETKEYEFTKNDSSTQKLLDKCKDIQKYILEYQQTQKLPPKCKDSRCRACKES